MTDWIILRTAGRCTLTLSESLGKDGFEAWTPVETVTLRARRSHRAMEVAQPLMPSFVFARSTHLEDLLELSRSPSLSYRRWDSDLRRMVTHGHAFFRVMRGLDTFGPFALVSDAKLAPLRSIEHRRRPKSEVARFSEGDRVRLTEGGYAGLYGVVTDAEGSFPEVQIDGWNFPVKVSIWLLHLDLDEDSSCAVSHGPSAQAQIAKAA